MLSYDNLEVKGWMVEGWTSELPHIKLIVLLDTKQQRTCFHINAGLLLENSVDDLQSYKNTYITDQFTIS